MRRLLVRVLLVVLAGFGAWACSGSGSNADATADGLPDALGDAGGDASLPDTAPDRTDDSAGDAFAPDGDGASGPETPTETTTPGDTFRFAVISDPTLLSNDLRGWNHKLAETVTAINGEEGLAFVLVLGDLAANMSDYWHPDAAAGTYAAGLDLTVQALKGLEPPHYVVPGDKDYTDEYNVRDGFEVVWSDWAARNAALKAALGDAYPGPDPWFAFSHGGVRFVGLNSAAGPRLQESAGQVGSLGAAQLAALDTELAGDAPVILFAHHRYDITLEEGAASLEASLGAAAADVLAVFNGHMWSYHEYDAPGAEGYAVHAVCEAPIDGSRPFYAVVEVDAKAGTVKVVNHADLPFPKPVALELCEPAPNSAAPDAGFVDSYHGLFVTEMTTDDPGLNSLFAAADIGETPFVFRVHADNGNGSYQVTTTQAGHYHDYMGEGHTPGDHALMWDYTTTVPPCVSSSWALDGGCFGGSVPVTYDLMRWIDPEGFPSMCGLVMPLSGEVTISLAMALDDGGSLTLDEGVLQVALDKPTVVAAVRDFLVRAYCDNGDCFLGEQRLYMPQEGCDPSANGHAEACAEGSLGFGDIPAQCDMSVGAMYKVPLRAVLALADKLPEAVVITARGWGHRMTAEGWPEADWSLQANEIFAAWRCGM